MNHELKRFASVRVFERVDLSCGDIGTFAFFILLVLPVLSVVEGSLPKGIMHLKRGDVAQMGERLLGMQEVVGSIPIISTRSERKKAQKWAFFFCPILVIF